jgi:hypothetical protein
MRWWSRRAPSGAGLTARSRAGAKAMRAGLAVVGVLLLLAAPVLAAETDLSGRYQGTGRGQSTVLDLTQTGETLQGTFQFADGAQGSLQGQWIGRTVKGMILIPGVGQARFEARPAPREQLELRIIEPGKLTDAVFVRIGPVGGGEEPAGQTAAAPQSTASFMIEDNGVTVGPYSVVQMVEKLRLGIVKPDQRVRRSNRLGWMTAAGVPELRAAAEQAGVTLPPAPPPAVSALEDTPDLDEPNETETVHDAATEIATAGRPNAPTDLLNTTVACLENALTPLREQDWRQFLFDMRSGTAPADGSTLEQAFPGLEGALKDLEPRYAGLGTIVKGCL